MNAERLIPRLVPAFILILLGTLSACQPVWNNPAVTPTFYHAPSGFASPAPPPAVLQPAAASPGAFPTPAFPAPTLLPAEATVLSTPCTNGLTWLADVTYEDDTVVLPGQSLDKQGRVKNSGTCDWDEGYKLVNINGEALGALETLPLYPARAGAEITLRILFTAPAEAGTYKSEWQALAPDGSAFGDSIYIQIIVNP